MKFKIVFTAFLLLNSLIIIAQTKPNVEKKSYKTLAKQEAGMLKQQLNLSQKQSTEIEAVEMEFMEKRRNIGAKPGEPTINKSNELDSLANWRKGMYQKILSTKQYEDYQQLLLKRKEEYRTKSLEMIKKSKQTKG